MKTAQNRWRPKVGWEPAALEPGPRVQLALVFGSPSRLEEHDRLDEIRQAYPKAHVVTCSTAGEIAGTEVTDDALVVTAIEFDSSRVRAHKTRIDTIEASREVGRQLASAISPDGLVHVLVLSEGLTVNGSELVAGLYEHLPPDVNITGGLSGDGPRFERTLVGLDGPPEPGTVVAIGLYGPHLRIGYGSLGGWDPFGPERKVTRSAGNVLYELDGEPALSLYKRYLGEHAEGLPATGLLFPLSLRHEGERGVVRTILSVNEDDKSMVFAGDVPEGAYAQLMKANFDRLVDGAIGAAQTSCEVLGSNTPDLAILISCVGRKLVLKQRVEEEVEGVRDVLGDNAVLTGFYSYGEIAPFMSGVKCELHNQTMTITTISEREP
jgi:hypothetical protein